MAGASAGVIAALGRCTTVDDKIPVLVWPPEKCRPFRELPGWTQQMQRFGLLEAEAHTYGLTHIGRLDRFEIEEVIGLGGHVWLNVCSPAGLTGCVTNFRS